MAADIRYFKSPNETVDEYKTRVASFQSPITSQALTIQQPFNAATPNYLPIPTLADYTPSTSNYALGAQGQQEQDYTDRLTQLRQTLSGEGVRTDSTGKIISSNYGSQLRGEKGLAQIQSNIDELATQYKNLQLEASALPLQLEQQAVGKGITTSVLVGQQQAALRNNAIQALGVQTRLNIAQGLYDSAVKSINELVEQKYGVQLAEIDTLKTNIDTIKNSPAYTLEDKKRADAAAAEVRRREDIINLEKENYKTIQGMAAQAQQNGAPLAVTSGIANARTLQEALIAGQGWTAKETAQSIQEYNFAVRNGYKGSYTQYQNEDANRKMAIARAGVGLTGLPTQQFNALNQITTRFQADSIINQAIKGQTAVAIADQIIANPNSATSQLKALYVLVKNLDPDSAVREGELALANQTQSYLQQFGNTLTRVSEGRVISPDAAKDLAQATKELLVAWNSTAQKRQRQYDSQAKTLGVGSEFGSYVAGSDLGYNQTASGGSTGVAVGEIRTGKDGKRYQKVEGGWVPMQ